jgi:hypothetical protein
MARNRRSTFGMVWEFRTKRFIVALHLEQERRYKYDGDDEGGETQAKLDSGEYVAFTSKVTVELDGEEIAVDYLFGSVYAADDVAAFCTAHRDKDPMNRNYSLMRAARGDVTICHYFPDMVRVAVQAAREHCNSFPKMRTAA